MKYPERKEEVALTISDKLKGILTTEQFSKVKKDNVKTKEKEDENNSSKNNFIKNQQNLEQISNSFK